LGGNKQPYEAFATGRVTIGTTPTKIISGLQGCDNISIINTSSGTVYVGGPSVSTTTGFPMTGTGSVGSLVDLCTTQDVWGVVATGTADVAYIITS
jgi:hypothetical protein